jgi:hypothetical protein
LLAAVVLAAAPAASGGFGANFTYTHGSGEIDDVDNFFPDIDTDSDNFEAGLSYDTNLAADRLFNYRVSANFAYVEQQLDVFASQVDIQGYGVSINQLFGFGIFRSPALRIFLGPAIQLGYVKFDDRDTLRLGNTRLRVDFDEQLFTASIGPEIGVNYHLNDNVTLSLTGFYRYGVQLQYYDEPFDSFGSDGVLLGDQHRFGLSTTIFFRFDSDQFE